MENPMEAQALPQPAAPSRSEPEDPVVAYLARRLRAAEDEALAANGRLAKALDAVARLSAIAERFKVIAEAKDRELAATRTAAAQPAATETRPAKARKT